MEKYPHREWAEGIAEEARKGALSRQEGGNHYKDMPIQPIEYCHANHLGVCESFAVKYVSRWRNKNGVADLRKAIHCIELLIEMEENKA